MKAEDFFMLIVFEINGKERITEYMSAVSSVQNINKFLRSCGSFISYLIRLYQSNSNFFEINASIH